MDFDLIVKDNFFPDPAGLRQDVLAKGFKTHRNEVDGVEYTGIQMRDPGEFEEALSQLVGFPVQVRLNVARRNSLGEKKDNFIHPDHGMGEFAAVGYLTKPSDATTGTAFWTDKISGLSRMPTAEELKELGIPENEYLERLRKDASSLPRWSMNAFVAATPGRLVTYPGNHFHSLWPFRGFGDTDENSRLIIAIFYDRK